MYSEYSSGGPAKRKTSMSWNTSALYTLHFSQRTDCVQRSSVLTKRQVTSVDCFKSHLKAWIFGRAFLETGTLCKRHFADWLIGWLKLLWCAIDSQVAVWTKSTTSVKTLRRRSTWPSRTRSTRWSVTVTRSLNLLSTNSQSTGPSTASHSDVVTELLHVLVHVFFWFTYSVHNVPFVTCWLNYSVVVNLPLCDFCSKSFAGVCQF